MSSTGSAPPIELQIASRRADGSLRKFVTIWAVRSGDDVYVRSAYGHDNGWFRRALASGEAASAPAAWNATSRSRSRLPTWQRR